MKYIKLFFVVFFVLLGHFLAFILIAHVIGNSSAAVSVIMVVAGFSVMITAYAWAVDKYL